jgi:hypothetical protein
MRWVEFTGGELLKDAGTAGSLVHRLLRERAIAHYIERLGGFRKTRGEQEAGDQGEGEMLD